MFWSSLTPSPPSPFPQALFSGLACQEAKEVPSDRGLGFQPQETAGARWAAGGAEHGGPVGGAVCVSSCPQLRTQAVFGCFVSRVSCVRLVLCFLGNFEVNSCSVSRLALTSLSDCILSPFASARWCPGPLSPPPPPHHPFSFGALDAQT